MQRNDGLCEIIVVDDGSSDFTYEIAWAAIQLNRRRYPKRALSEKLKQIICENERISERVSKLTEKLK